jgi:hypothetical protein
MMMTALSFIVTSCDELTSEGLSTVYYFPIVTLNGEQWNAIDVGTAFTDPGAAATQGEESLEVVVSGDAVDVNTPGVYTIVYTATNADGYTAVERRYVGVISPEAAALDLTGSYQRNAGAFGVSNVSRIAPGLYYTDNIGGTAPPTVPAGVYFYHYDETNLGVPQQLVNGSLFYAEDATVSVGSHYSWSVINAGYGDALRIFEKL